MRDPRRARGLTDALLLPGLLERLKAAPLGPHDHPARLVDLMALLRPLHAFPALARALLDHDAEPARFQAAWLDLLPHLPPRAHHHLALLHLRWGFEALDDPRLTPTQRPRDALRRWTTALKHLGPVLADADLFDQLAAAAGAPGKGPALRQRVPDLLLEPHGQALLDAFSPDAPAAAAAPEAHWKLLTEAPDRAADLLPPPHQPHPALAAAAARWRARIVEHVLGHAEALAREVDPTTASPEQLQRPFFLAQRFTHVASAHEPLSVWAIEQAVEWGWILYKTRDEARLQPLILATRTFNTHLESLLLRGTGAFGRQALCADWLVFAADFAERDEQLRIFLRALKVCPNHRNARLMLSYHWLQDANAHLARLEAASRDPLLAIAPGIGADQRAAFRAAEDAITRAEEYFPSNERLPDYKKRLDAARLKLPA